MTLVARINALAQAVGADIKAVLAQLRTAAADAENYAKLNAVNTFPTRIALRGGAEGISSVSYLEFVDSANARTGYVGKGANNTGEIYVSSTYGGITLANAAGYYAQTTASPVLGDSSLKIATTAFVRTTLNEYGLGYFGKTYTTLAGINAARPCEFFIHSGAADTTPFPVPYVAGIHCAYGGAYNYAVEICGAVTQNNRFFGRTYNNGTWRDSVEFWHSGNFAPAGKYTAETGSLAMQNMVYSTVTADPGSNLPYASALEIREAGKVTTTRGTSSWLRPSITFHWGGAVVNRLSMDTAADLWWGTGKVLTTENLVPNKLEARTQATLPSAAASQGQMFLCTNTTTRGARPVYSDGSNWLRLEDNSLITAA